MTAAQAMEYGIFSFDFSVPDGFRAVYPLRCGYQYATEQAVLCDAPQTLLVYVLDGSGEARVGEAFAPCRADCVLFAARADSLSLSPHGRVEYLSLLLENALPPPAPIPAPVCQLNADNALRRMLERVCRNGRARAGSIYDASADAFRLLMKLCELSSHERGVYSRLVGDAIDCIREEFAFLTGIDDLADRMGVSKSHLIRAFSAETGVTPGHFLQETRLENAMLLLRGREYSIDMVAGLCGFSGANYFCKVFRRAVGESPGEYRNHYAGQRLPDLENRRRLLEMERRQLL